MVEEPVNPKCGLRVECVRNRPDNSITSLEVEDVHNILARSLLL